MSWYEEFDRRIKLGLRCPICPKANFSYRAVEAIDWSGLTWKCQCYYKEGGKNPNRRTLHTSAEFIKVLRLNQLNDPEVMITTENEFGPVCP